SKFGSRNLTLISIISISRHCNPLIAKPSYVVRVDSNPNVVTVLDVVDEVPETDAEEVSESDHKIEQLKSSRQTRVKLGDVMGILHKRIGDIIEIILEFHEKRIERLTMKLTLPLPHNSTVRIEFINNSVVRDDSNPDAVLVSDGVDEVPETDAEEVSESGPEIEQLKSSRQTRVKLGDVMGILHKRTGDILEIILDVPQKKIKRLTM
ncbi:hypothetical protein RYX36_021262, partial [Vicia faba]